MSKAASGFGRVRIEMLPVRREGGVGVMERRVYMYWRLVID